MRVSGAEYYPLDGIAVTTYVFNLESQSLDITVPPSVFIETALDGVGTLKVKATPPDPGVFLNHDFQLLHDSGQVRLTGLVEGGSSAA
jgi:hypothetical protein